MSKRLFTTCLSLVREVLEMSKSTSTYRRSHLLRNIGNLGAHLIEKTRPPSTRIFSSISPIIKEPRSDDLVSRIWILTRHFNPLGSPYGYLENKVSCVWRWTRRFNTLWNPEWCLRNKVKFCQPKMEFASNTFTLVRV